MGNKTARPVEEEEDEDSLAWLEGADEDDDDAEGAADEGVAGRVAAEPAADKAPARAPAKPKHSAPLDVSKLVASAAAAPAARRGRWGAAATAGKDAGAASEGRRAELELGANGAVWEVLEDAQVQQDRDPKSARLGVLQVGERCTQRDAWKMDQSGRVRMPIAGPRSLNGWVTADARNFRNAAGEWGQQVLKLVEAPADENAADAADADAAENTEAQARPMAKASAAEDLEDLLDMFGGDDLAAVPGASKAAPREARTSAKTLWRQQKAAEKQAAEASAAAAAAEEAEKETAAKANSEASKAQLTEAERTLRNVRKKLRELEGKQGQDLRKAELVQLELVTKEQVLQEQREAKAASAGGGAAETSGGARKRKKKPAGGAAKTAAGKAPAEQARGWTCASALSCALLLIAVSAFGAAIASQHLTR
eukprot:TRINITY_DN2629_c1_g1_i1.p1 TRINITY_DN2629_c1_g1~~TRINITY_DN2629_c1_g1_i1.p1  ORF type:complete len:425 (+),score=139.67 TRINITY_DN2629_c1_g1_i1:57-1331(+)